MRCCTYLAFLPQVLLVVGLLVEVLILVIVVLADHLLDVLLGHAVHVLNLVEHLVLRDERVIKRVFGLVFLLCEQVLEPVLKCVFDLALVEADDGLMVNVVVFNHLIGVVRFV